MAGFIQVSDVDVSEGPLLDFSEFYEVWRDPLRRALALAVGDIDEANEAIDEAMTRALERWDRVRRYELPEGWVYRVGLNWLRGSYRKRRREVIGHVDEKPGFELETPDLVVVAAVASLPWTFRQVVIARYYLDWSTADTAAALGIAEGTVKSRLARALRRIGQALEEEQ